MPTYFTPDYASFFQELDQNNHKTWFDEHRKRYEQSVRKPFLKLVADLQDALLELDPLLDQDPKKALFRINRDIRFSKDKTPYHTLMKATLARGGRKSRYAGYFLGIGANLIHVGGGLLGIEKKDLHSIRQAIAHQPQDFQKLIEEKRLVDTYSQLNGERNTRIPKEFQAAAEQTPFVANKQFYVMATFPVHQHLYREDLLAFLVDQAKKVTPLNRFLQQAVG
ncbi:MAG: DUF2461 domain-containing protein [Bacteroidota bacterium]